MHGLSKFVLDNVEHLKDVFLHIIKELDEGLSEGLEVSAIKTSVLEPPQSEFQGFVLIHAVLVTILHHHFKLPEMDFPVIVYMVEHFQYALQSGSNLILSCWLRG